MWTLITVLAVIATITTLVTATYRWQLTRTTVNATFERSLRQTTNPTTELAANNPTSSMPPTYLFWFTKWVAAGLPDRNPRTPGNTSVVVAVIGATFGVIVFPTGIPGLTVALLTIGAYWAYLSTLAAKRITVMEKQLPLLLSGMRSGLSAGAPPQTALIDIADSIPQPLGAEVSTIKNELATGVSLETALTRFAERVPTRQIHFLVASMKIAVSSGSDLHPQLIVIEDIYEQRARIAGKIRSSLALVRPTAWLAETAPLLALLWSLSSDPTAMDYYLGEGMIMFIVAGVLYLSGIITVNTMMRRLTNSNI